MTMIQISNKLLAIFVCIISLSCSKNNDIVTNVRLDLVSKFKIETLQSNELLNSKISVSDSILLVKVIKLNHATESIADSSLLFFVKGKRVFTNNSFSLLKKRFYLQNLLFDKLLFSKHYLENGQVDISQKSKSGMEFLLYNENHNTKSCRLKILNRSKKLIGNFTFKTNHGIPAFFLKDITGDHVEEIFFVEWNSGYWGNDYYFKVFMVNITFANTRLSNMAVSP